MREDRGWIKGKPENGVCASPLYVQFAKAEVRGGISQSGTTASWIMLINSLTKYNTVHKDNVSIDRIFDDRMAPYMIGPNWTLLNSKPVRLYVEPPLGTFVSSETFPPPISQYMVNATGEERKSPIFSLDFLGGTQAQTVSCTLINPSAEYVVQVLIFLAGILAATGVYFTLSMFIEFLKEKLSVTKMQYD